ncbi:MAG: amidohydrolase [Chloroflexota bacterium]|nr:amidohydrolase [Chloroflexota bacterium]
MRIDIHAHYFPDEYLDLLQRFGNDTTDMARDLGAGGSQGELEARFELMEAANVQMQLLSVSPQLPSFEDKASAIEGARMANDLYANLVRRYPKRFVALAALPLPHMEATLAEMTRALDGLGMAGVTITTSVLGRALVDPAFEPLYVELDRRGSILFIHPAGAGACSPLINDYKLTWPIGAPIEETIAITQLIVRGIPIRYPRIKIINTHLGGALPMLLQRLDNQYRMADPVTPELPSVQAKRMWYDSVGHFHIPALHCACESLGADRIVLGTDFPYLRGEGYKRSVTYIENAGLPAADVQRILESNAQALLGWG